MEVCSRRQESRRRNFAGRWTCLPAKRTGHNNVRVRVTVPTRLLVNVRNSGALKADLNLPISVVILCTPLCAVAYS